VEISRLFIGISAVLLLIFGGSASLSAMALGGTFFGDIGLFWFGFLLGTATVVTVVGLFFYKLWALRISFIMFAIQALLGLFYIGSDFIIIPLLFIIIPVTIIIFLAKPSTRSLFTK
jgi:hypothetical protein